jgi:hypothetical protein
MGADWILLKGLCSMESVSPSEYLVQKAITLCSSDGKYREIYLFRRDCVGAEQ